MLPENRIWIGEALVLLDDPASSSASMRSPAPSPKDRSPPAPRAPRRRVTLPPLREVIARHGLSASKALGQNFLFDEQLLARIAAIPGDLRERVVGEHRVGGFADAFCGVLAPVA